MLHGEKCLGHPFMKSYSKDLLWVDKLCSVITILLHNLIVTVIK